MPERNPIRLSRYPCGCKTLAPREVSTVQFEMHLPKCEAYWEGLTATAGDHESWWQFRKQHFADQTPEVELCPVP